MYDKNVLSFLHTYYGYNKYRLKSLKTTMLLIEGLNYAEEWGESRAFGALCAHVCAAKWRANIE